MKNLKDYLSTIQAVPQETDMKPMKIVAEQNNTDIVLWNTEEDRWSRRAKHPLRLNEISTVSDVLWEKGEIAIYESQPVEITIPRGPSGTTGVIIEGRTKMVLASKLTKIDEGVLGGMQPLNPINRMMQLAGLSTATITEPVLEDAEILETDTTNMFEQLFKANLNGEYRNNPDAARLATIGEVMTGLASQIGLLQGKIAPDLETKINVAVGLGAAIMQAAKSMTQPK